MGAIADFRTRVLALLSDAGNAVFSNDNVDQALRWALAQYSAHRPFIRTYQYSVDATTGVHNLPADFITRHITKVELYDEDPDDIIDLAYYALQRDEQWIIWTRNEISAGEVLQISYSAIHTIDGLDAAAGTTLAAAEEPIIHVGAAGHAAQMRGLDRIETINMNKNVAQMYRLLATDYLLFFSQFSTIEPGIILALPDFPALDVT